MAHAFGGAWLSQYGTSEENAFRTWSKALSGYTIEQIQRGVTNATGGIEWLGNFPPNLAQFQKLCLTVTHPSHKPFQIEHHPQRSSKETVSREMQIINRMIESRFTETREEAAAALGIELPKRAPT